MQLISVLKNINCGFDLNNGTVTSAIQGYKSQRLSILTLYVIACTIDRHIDAEPLPLNILKIVAVKGLAKLANCISIW